MVQRPVHLSLPSLLLDPTTAMPRFRQLYEGLRHAILAGQFAPGTKLPSTRTVAEHLGVSRNTVYLAFEHLRSEGYVEGRQGAGTYVARVLPEALLTLAPAASSGATPPPGQRTVSQRSARLLGTAAQTLWHDRMPTAAFRVFPALDQFPRQLWQRLLVRSWRQGGEGLLSYGEDYAPLRQAIAGYLGPARGVRCTADQVILVAGAQQGLDLAARVLLEPGQTAWIEDPGYPGARGALLAAGVQPVPVPVDAEGLDIAAGVARHAGATLAYVTPSRQFPLGMTMSLRRRLELLAWATQAQAWILEDDYDSEYRYTGRPLAALQGLDRDARVIYVGTFSKVLFPALRLAYLVVPADMVDAFTTMRLMVSRHPPLLEQYVLAAFIAEGHFARHIRRMRRICSQTAGAGRRRAARTWRPVAPATGRRWHAPGGLVARWHGRRGRLAAGGRSGDCCHSVVGLHARGTLATSPGARLHGLQRTRDPQEHPPLGAGVARLMMSLVDQTSHATNAVTSEMTRERA